MADDNEQYELKTVRAIRGAEALTTAKWQKGGWEFVSQDKGTLRTEITLRRLKRKLTWRLVAVASAAVVLLITLTFTTNLFQDDDGAAVADPAAAEAAQSEPAPTIKAKTEPVEESVLTVENNADLAELLITDTCSSAVWDFATKYEGQTIAFDANIGAMQLHGGYTTRYDILISAGDFSETTSSGPLFQYRDVNTVSDLRYADDNRPDTIGVGDNVRITAQVVEYESVSCQFILKPVSTEFR
ncbi:DUF4839 domain-containing protein [Arthrobacter sp. zg-Y895]|uniref:DUF4839 domain-containing protein n=1 Tax=Arthrobacter sp. zg-Y895 TaxID=2886933 RepID=UPI001D13D038|nr:DUF4839 domain-containing protein [Arthrobacter sp. zg-Y895]MCC3300677.1 DUF4839 domain-containing protein [Arthrobacter sp. zg-Y895]